MNKYDGIDLPNNACRVLTIDGLPDVRRAIDKVRQNALSNSEQVIAQSIQRIEQGMGRGVRSNDDYCAVVLMGRSLVSSLYARDGITKFTAATRAQLELSNKLTEQLREQPVKETKTAIERFLARDKQWVKASRSVLVHVKYAKEGVINPTAINERKAFNFASVNDYSKAIAEIQAAVNRTDDKRLKGWLQLRLAQYMHPVNPVESQQLLKAAVSNNYLITKPLEGIEYVKLRPLNIEQAAQCIKYLKTSFPDPNRFIVVLNGYLDELVFRPETAPMFEEVLLQVARIIGFNSQRPGAAFGRKGPDVLWSIGGLRYIVIECKNGATTDTISKSDCDQLSGAVHWFREKYDDTCVVVPMMVHPKSLLHGQASSHPDMRVMTDEKLAKLKDALRQFGVAIASLGNYGDTKQVNDLLAATDLTAEKIAQTYSVPPRRAR